MPHQIAMAPRHLKNIQRADHVYLSTQDWICSAGGNLECRRMDDMSDAMVDHRAFQALRLRHITLDETSSAKPVLGKERLEPVSLGIGIKNPRLIPSLDKAFHYP